MRYKSTLLIFLGLLAFVACSNKTEETKAKISVTAQTPKSALPQNIASAALPGINSYEATLEEGIQFGEKPGYPSFIKSASGMSGYETNGRWTEGAKAIFTFANPLPSAFRLQLEIGGAFGPNEGKPIEVRVGDWKGEFTITHTALKPIDLDIKTSQPTDIIEFIIPDPRSPKELNASADPRPLGISFKRLSIQK